MHALPAPNKHSYREIAEIATLGHIMLLEGAPEHIYICICMLQYLD
jgi:hypothetical protein